jgi:hypothetical protein
VLAHIKSLSYCYLPTVNELTREEFFALPDRDRVRILSADPEVLDILATDSQLGEHLLAAMADPSKMRAARMLARREAS